MNEWKAKRSELEQQLIDAKQTVIKYEGTLKPFRTITESEYRDARRAVIDLATQISDGDYGKADLQIHTKE
ncbi:hypothetical protein P5658_26565 [Bacillus subtilis]|uniref:Uncharacterized protein n=1 Tax=Bacillus subtilis TaxID=1423 RepID=A0AC61ZZQ7_BACIU